jgi:hypothetical protein
MMTCTRPGAADSAAEDEKKADNLRQKHGRVKQGLKRAIAEDTAHPLRIQPSIALKILPPRGQLLG